MYGRTLPVQDHRNAAGSNVDDERLVVGASVGRFVPDRQHEIRVKSRRQGGSLVSIHRGATADWSQEEIHGEFVVGRQRLRVAGPERRDAIDGDEKAAALVGRATGLASFIGAGAVRFGLGRRRREVERAEDERLVFLDTSDFEGESVGLLGGPVDRLGVDRFVDDDDRVLVGETADRVGIVVSAV